MDNSNLEKQPLTLSHLSPAVGSRKVRKRIGRGDGSGSGGTAGKGHKGDKARSGYKAVRGFEGGQMPLQRRLPKFGFKSQKRIKGSNVYSIVGLDQIQALALKEKITIDILAAHGLVKNNKDRVKVLGGTDLKSKLSIEAHAFSASAKKAITQTGGEVHILS